YATRLFSNGAPSDARASVWRTKSYAMTFQDGPLGLALELDAHLVVVRSLTAVSQATHTVQSGDIILAINETPVGRLNDLTEFTDTVRSLPRPVSFRFYRPSLPLTTTSTTTKNAIRVTVGDILVAATWLECDKGLVVLSCSSSRVFQVGDTLTHINGVAVVGMTRAWLHDTLGVLPLYDQLLVVARPPPVPDVPVHVHPQCAATWNQAMIRGTALRQKWTAATALETFLKSVAPRTWPVGPYLKFPVASEESDAVATALHLAFQSRPQTPTSGPFSMRPHFTVTPSNQHESFVMLHGRQYFLGTFASASDAQTAYDQCQQRYDTRQLLLAPYSTTTFPRVALPSLKAEDFLKRLHVRRGPSCTPSSHHPLSVEMKYLVRYNIRAHRPKPSPPPTLTSNNEFVNHQGQLQQQYHGASTKKRPLPDADTASPYPITTTRTTSTNTSLEAHFKHLQELKTSIKQAWGSVQTSQNAQSCAHLSDALQSTHHTLTYVAQHLAKHPLDVATPLTFVGVHHASVLCLLTISMSESLAKTSQMTLADLQLMHMCGDNLLWSIQACVTPSLHHQVMSYCVELASKLPTMLASGLLSAQIKATALTMDSFFNSSKYLAEPASSSVSCRPLFAMLNNHHTATATNHDHHSQQPHQHSAIIQPLPPSLTQELWKLHTCQGQFDKMLKKLKVPWPPPQAAHPQALAATTSTSTTSTNPSNQSVAASPTNRSLSSQDSIVSFEAGPLGIIIQQEDSNNVITVASFAAGDQGQALRSGKVAVGDVIVAVNGDPISTIGIDGFKRAVSSGVRPLLITFRRRQHIHNQQASEYQYPQPPSPDPASSMWAAAHATANAALYASNPMYYNMYNHTMQPPTTTTPTTTLDGGGGNGGVIGEMLMQDQSTSIDLLMHPPFKAKQQPPAAVDNTSSTVRSTGRRSSRVSRKPEPLVSHTSATPSAVPPPTLHIPGAGTQGEFATDSLPVSKAMVTTSLAFSLVQAQLLAIEAALPRDAFRHNKWTPALRTGWADLIVHATSSRTLLEALLVLEATIENEYLDPTFKAQSSLTIKMLLPTATIASAAMRLYALDDALSYFKPQSSISPALLKDPTLKDRFIAVLQTLQTKAAVAAPFLKPVDPDEFPTYRRIVPYPMDLHTMLQRVQDGVYDNRLQHIPIDMSRIWTNCFAFNSVQAEISTLARRLR
ncbi:hypothetical protein DYB28_002430, partial [Aphanomyces astaci]